MTQRFQLYFPVELYLRLKEESSRQRTSIADFVRRTLGDALSAAAKNQEPDPLDAIVGHGRSKDTDLSYRHDKYLYDLVKDAPSKKRKK